MENSPDIPQLSVIEAHALYKKNKYVMHQAIHDVMIRLNLTESNATICRMKRRYLLTMTEKNIASRRGRLAQWISNAEKEEFYSYVPTVMSTATVSAPMPAATSTAAVPVITVMPAATVPAPMPAALLPLLFL